MKGEKGDLIMMLKAVKEIENVDMEDFLTSDDGRIRGHEHKLKKARCLNNFKQIRCLNNKKFSFPSTDAWNELDTEVVRARNIYDFKNKITKSRYEDWTTQA